MIRDNYVKSRLNLITDTIRKVSKFKGDSQIAIYLDSYLVVLISGIYEDCIEYLINNRVGKVGDKEISAFIEKTVHITFRNPNYDNLIQLLERFSKKWVGTMNKKLRQEAKTSLNNIVTNKNAVAHGGISNLTINEIKECHKNCKSIFEKLEKII